MRGGTRHSALGTRRGRWAVGILAAGVLGGASLGAQEARANRESRIPALPATDTSTSSFDVAGIKVILRKVTANQVVAANLYLLGGTRQVTAENAGIELLLLEATERGTRRYPKDALRRKMASLGSGILVGPSEDWTVLGLRTNVAGFDSTWAVFADRLTAPTLDSSEVEQVRSQLVFGIRQRRESPDALVEFLADSVAFPGHPYGLSPTGTEHSLSRITLAELRRYHAEQVVRSRMLLVVVGNVERERLERLVRGTLSRLPAGSYSWTPPPPLPDTLRSTVVVESRPLPTNYIQGYFPGPPATSPDYQALRVASAALSGRLYGEIRTRRNLTYAVNAPFIQRALSAGGLYVTTVSPDTVLALMRAEIGDLRRDRISEAGLEQLVQQFITEYFLDNETNSDQANFLARAQLYRGDWRTAERFVDELRQVTPEDVRRVADKYMRNVRFAYVGDPRRLNRGYIERF